MNETSFRLAPVLPIRAGAIAACGIIVSGILIALNNKDGLGFWAWFGIVLLVLSLTLAGMTAFLYSRTGTKVVISDEGYEVSRLDRPQIGQWTDVTKIARTPEGDRIEITHGKLRRAYISAPRGGDDPEMQALIREIADRIVKVKAKG